MRHLLLPLLISLACMLPPARAAGGGFIGTLSAKQQAATGLTRLSADEQTALNALVAREVSFARQGSVQAFAGTFISRRKPAERTEAGLDRLTAAEQEKLNESVAAAIASAPARPEPREWKKSDVASARDRLQIHGGISLTYGWGGGGNFRAGSIYTDIYDPETGLELGVGLSQISGRGWWGYGPDYSGYDPYWNGLAAPIFTDFRGGWIDARGTGDCFRRH